ncbi:ABC transporter ATP-binding protein [Aureimonas sp. AU40]|uniref:ABC transporter ATP-binding protein n=1 Tax=Aureimonas sp. AU40 TaxID=1637747 RepID=UPI0007817640|nr:ABC transporter ATP-binding protein [Aureimonas sp. AU40]
MTIRAENLVWKAGKTVIVDDVSLEAEPGRMLGLLGPNGSGKTSLLRILAGLRRAHSGRVTLDGTEIGTVARKALARRIAYVEQSATSTADLKVVDVVKLGRIPHRSALSPWTAADEAAVETALASAGMSAKREASWAHLSGGERQRVQIARALAQAPREIFLDEPTNHLDVEHQIALLRLVSELKLTSIVALHDLNHAALFCDRLVVLKGGRVVAAGPPEEVLTEDLLREVFNVRAHVEPSRHHGRPHIQYLV